MLKPFESEEALHKQIAEVTRNYIKAVQGNGEKGTGGNGGNGGGQQADKGPEPKGAPVKSTNRRGDSEARAPKTEDGKLIKELLDEI